MAWYLTKATIWLYRTSGVSRQACWRTLRLSCCHPHQKQQSAELYRISLTDLVKGLFWVTPDLNLSLWWFVLVGIRIRLFNISWLGSWFCGIIKYIVRNNWNHFAQVVLKNVTINLMCQQLGHHSFCWYFCSPAMIRTSARWLTHSGNNSSPYLSFVWLNMLIIKLNAILFLAGVCFSAKKW